MQEHKVVISRVITSNRFSPIIKKSIQERIEDFVETRQLLSLYPFSAEYSVKVAMPKGGRAGGSSRNAAADNKARRTQELNFKRLGIYCYDPKATKKPKQYFETKPRFNLDGQLGDVANVGWLDIPKTVSPEKYNEEVKQFFLSQRGKPKIIARPATKNKRTGQLEVKALGDKIGRATGNIAQAAARAVGIILDPSGRLRCPPGVPAANQFTDEIGSNCFDFTPAIGRALVEVAKRASSAILEEVFSLDGAISLISDEDGGVMSVSREAAARTRGFASATRGMATSTGRIRGTLLGPDGRPLPPPAPDFDREVADLAASATPITPDRYEEVFEDLIRRAYPTLSVEKVKELTKAAVKRQRIRDKQRKDVEEVLGLAEILGVDIDQTDANSVQRGLAKVISLLQLPENGGWGANFDSYFGGGFSRDIDVAMARHKSKQINAIIDYLLTDPQKFGFTADEIRRIIDTKFRGTAEQKEQEFLKALREITSGAKTVEEVFGTDPTMSRLLLEVNTKWDKRKQVC
jgi:hypothetical protein